MHHDTGLCTDSQTVRYYEYGMDCLFVKDGVFSNFGDLYYRLNGTIRYGVRYGAKLALPVQKWPQKGLSSPTLPISKSSILLSRVEATQCFPE
jgi:hypothetical protein